jgi:hypothetical protein
MTSKYKKSPPKPKKETNPNPPMENEKPNAEEKSTHEQHKEFVKSAEESMKQSNEPTPENFDNVTSFDNPTIEREYTSAGYKKGEGAQSAGSINNGSTNAAEGTAHAPIDDFEPSPPPPDDENYADTHNPNEGGAGDGDPLKIPSGNAEDLIDFGANALNFLIGNFAGKLVSVKIRPQYHSIKDNKTRAIDIITEFNEKSVEKIKLDDEDIAMLKPPLVKLLQEKGIRGLTPGEELMLAIAMIAAKKVKAIVEIRSESKKLQEHFDSMIQYMRQDFKKDAKEDITPPPSGDEGEIPLTPTEEV